MDVAPGILFGKVMHKRLFPKVNAFTYGMYYIALPLSQLDAMADGCRFSVDRFGILSFYRKDHGRRDGGDLNVWAREILREQNIETADGDILLITMPRVLGYVFNPVSFWLCLDREKGLRAVICEVNNTFGENHTYLCAMPDGGVIADDLELSGEKLFHVSPFLKREGHYRFRFTFRDQVFGSWINFYDDKGRQQLLTALTGHFSPWTRADRRRAFWRYPLITLKAIGLIHWQAARLITRGIKYVPKPIQLIHRKSAARNITKN